MQAFVFCVSFFEKFILDFALDRHRGLVRKRLFLTTHINCIYCTLGNQNVFVLWKGLQDVALSKKQRHGLLRSNNSSSL